MRTFYDEHDGYADRLVSQAEADSEANTRAAHDVEQKDAELSALRERVRVLEEAIRKIDDVNGELIGCDGEPDCVGCMISEIIIAALTGLLPYTEERYQTWLTKRKETCNA